jgi:hypothetical protein
MKIVNFYSTVTFTLLFIVIYFGITKRLFMAVISFLALPVYFGIYAIEDILASKKEQDSILKFNLPQVNPKRYYTDIVASLITVCYLVFGLNVYFKGNNKTFVTDFLSGKFFPFPWSVLPISLFVVLYRISYGTARDTADIHDKFKNLSVSSIFDKLLTKFFGK